MNVDNLSWWDKVRTFEPQLLRGILTAVVALAAMFGLELTPYADKIDEMWILVFPLIPLIQAWWTRRVTEPTAVVVEKVEQNGTVVAGAANELPTGLEIRELGEPIPEPVVGDLEHDEP